MANAKLMDSEREAAGGRFEDQWLTDVKAAEGKCGGRRRASARAAEGNGRVMALEGVERGERGAKMGTGCVQMGSVFVLFWWRGLLKAKMFVTLGTGNGARGRRADHDRHGAVGLLFNLLMMKKPRRRLLLLLTLLVMGGANGNVFSQERMSAAAEGDSINITLKEGGCAGADDHAAEGDSINITLKEDGRAGADDHAAGKDSAFAGRDSVRVHRQKRMPDMSLGDSGVNLGLAGRRERVSGLQMMLLGGYGRRVSGVQASGMLGAATELKGVQMSGLSTVAGRLRGLQLAGLNNSVLTPLEGLQVAAGSNVAMGVRRGAQVASANIAQGRMSGAQIGAYNYADTLGGAQIGLFNAAQRRGRGVQVGLMNFSRDTTGHSFGLVNVNPRTRIDFMAFAGTTSKINTGVRFRNGRLFSMVAVGTHYMGLDKHFSGAVSYRAGGYLWEHGRWALSADVGASHVETFAEGDDDTARRLYSLQAHVNADYGLTPRWGLFGSMGYGETRYYSHHEHYRRGWMVQLGVSYHYDRNLYAEKPLAAMLDRDTVALYNDFGRRRKSWTAAAEVAGINVFVHCFDRFVTRERFAMTTMRSIRRNLRCRFVWDNDYFSTNLIAHPYHGNLYFNAARSTGHSFWQAAPFALGGSLMWELVGEKDPPAINDVFATTMGGICIGEITYRLSDCLIDHRQRGWNRFLREAAVTLLSPMKGFNRIISGRAWRTSADEPPLRPTRLRMRLTAEGRYLADNGDLFKGEWQPALTFDLEYGDVLDNRNNKPYDYFALNATFGFTGNQPLVNNVHLLGRLWSATVVETKQIDSELGVYQHFNYYNSNPVKNGSELTPYKISEAASVGPGFVFRYYGTGALRQFEQRAFVSAVLLGGTKSDYYNVLDRDYNMGSGYSLKTQTKATFRAPISMELCMEHYRFFTWKGYSEEDLESVDPFYLNAQGDKGNAALTVVKTQMCFPLTAHLDVNLSNYWFFRRTHYSYHDDVRANTFEMRVGLAYEL